MLGKLGLPELVLILAIVLIIFGPRKLPEMGRSIGRGIREFRQATSKENYEGDGVNSENEKLNSRSIQSESSSENKNFVAEKADMS